jgi:non-heme chloroperoxidase
MSSNRKRNKSVNRRSLLEGVAIAGAGITLAAASGHVAAQSKGAPPTSSSRPPFVTTKDGMRLFVQDWGTGRPVILLSAWTFNSSVWGSYIAALNAAGFRCIAPDRRGHGRSDTPMSGYDLDTLTDDVAAVNARALISMMARSTRAPIRGRIH